LIFFINPAPQLHNDADTLFYFVCGSRYIDIISAWAASKVKLSTFITGHMGAVSALVRDLADEGDRILWGLRTICG
jgi:hypothetical protein